MHKELPDKGRFPHWEEQTFQMLMQLVVQFFRPHPSFEPAASVYFSGIY